MNKKKLIRKLLGGIFLIFVIPSMFLTTLEFSLRGLGIGENFRFFVDEELEGYVRSNPKFTGLFFPLHFGLKPVNFRMKSEKPQDEFRVFVLGGSAAMGIPEPAFGVVPQLQVLLQNQIPDKRVRVFNLAVTAINSHVVRVILEDAISYNPDLVFVYAGNNEVVGPFGPGSMVGADVPSVDVIRRNIFLKRLRIGQILGDIMQGLQSKVGRTEWLGMESFAENQVNPSDPRLTQMYENYQTNLRSMMDLLASNSVPVVLSTVAVNVDDSAPFSADDVDESLVLSCWNALKLGYPEYVISGLLNEPEIVTYQFLLGKAFDDLKEDDKAEDCFAKALEMDRLRFRANSKINEIIRGIFSEFSGNDSFVLCDFAEKLSGGGRDYFHEHVHFKHQGHFELAKTFAKSVLSEFEDRSDFHLMNIEQAEEAIGYTDFALLKELQTIDVLTSRAPFSSQCTFADDRTQLERELKAVKRRLSDEKHRNLCLEIIREAVDANSDPHLKLHLASILTNVEEHSAALSLVEDAELLLPPSSETDVIKAGILLEMERSAEALELMLNSLKKFPYDYSIYKVLAMAWANSSNQSEGIEFFRGKIEKHPHNRYLKQALADLYLSWGEGNESEKLWSELLDQNPGFEGALNPYVLFLFEKKRVKYAKLLMGKAYLDDPFNHANNLRLASFYEARKEFSKALKYSIAAVKSGYVSPILFIKIAKYYALQNDLSNTRLYLTLGQRAAENDEAVSPDLFDELIRANGGLYRFRRF